MKRLLLILIVATIAGTLVFPAVASAVTWGEWVSNTNLNYDPGLLPAGIADVKAQLAEDGTWTDNDTLVIEATNYGQWLKQILPIVAEWDLPTD